jgi:hypothetical protein
MVTGVSLLDRVRVELNLSEDLVAKKNSPSASPATTLSPSPSPSSQMTDQELGDEEGVVALLELPVSPCSDEDFSFGQDEGERCRGKGIDKDESNDEVKGFMSIKSMSSTTSSLNSTIMCQSSVFKLSRHNVSIIRGGPRDSDRTAKNIKCRRTHRWVSTRPAMSKKDERFSTTHDISIAKKITPVFFR